MASTLDFLARAQQRLVEGQNRQSLGPNGGNFVKACAGFFRGAISMLDCKSV